MHLRCLLAIMLMSSAAVADTMDDTFVPPECDAFRTIPGGLDSPIAWDQVFSFTSCAQDASVPRVRNAAELPGMIAHLDELLAPSLRHYAIALENGPGPVRIRAAYYIGLSQVAMLTRARLAIGHDAKLRAKLEPLLEDTALLAWKSFMMIDLVVASDSTLAPDAVTQEMAKSARIWAAALANTRAPDRAPLLASP